MAILAVLFSSFAFLANAQKKYPFAVNATERLTNPNIFPASGNVGIRLLNPQFPFQVWDGGTNVYTGIGINPGDSPTEIGSLFAYKDKGFLLFAGGQDSGRGQSGIFLGSSVHQQRITNFSQSFYFNITDYPTFLDGTQQGTNIVRIDDTYDPATYVAYGPHLRVLGGIKAKKVTVTQNVWADYVFEKNYKLLPLADVERFIEKNKHLPEIPSAKEIEKNGQDLGGLQVLQMQKIEELTLYLIAQEKRIQLLEQKLLEIQKKK